ncbi:TetR/AcrR family transcriptional regulator [Streptomyces sp. URMC 123]|uniref:TetR/AcrR family transcriptional regulator n=1 Tax=Streptomyces sp. URMC 123 TaxID=3423403 RepID=UPI003F1DBD51
MSSSHTGRTAGAGAVDRAVGEAAGETVEGAVEPAGGERPKRVTRRRVLTRQRLLEAALQVFAERGPEAATVEEVCERAGYTRGAFYSNFRTMEELFTALCQYQADVLLDHARQVLLEEPAECGPPGGADGTSAPDGPDSPDGTRRPGGQAATTCADDDGVEAAVEKFLAVLPENRAWWLVTMEYHLYAARHPESAGALADLRRRFREQLAPVLETALARTGRRLLVSADELARVLIAVHEGAVAQSYLEPDDVPYEHLDRLALPHLVRSLSAPIEPSDTE